MQTLLNDRVMIAGIPCANDEGLADVFLDIDDGRYLLRRVPVEEADRVVFEIAVALTGWVPAEMSVLEQHEKTLYPMADLER